MRLRWRSISLRNCCDLAGRQLRAAGPFRSLLDDRHQQKDAEQQDEHVDERNEEPRHAAAGRADHGAFLPIEAQSDERGNSSRLHFGLVQSAVAGVAARGPRAAAAVVRGHARSGGSGTGTAGSSLPPSVRIRSRPTLTVQVGKMLMSAISRPLPVAVIAGA